MTMPSTNTMRTLLALALACAVVPAAFAQDEEDKDWEHSAELSLVATSGNSEAITFAFKYSLAREWQKGRFKAGLSGLRAESDTGRRTAVGTPDAFDVVDTRESEVTAENYSLNARFERDVSEQLFWFVGGGWERNEFAGVDNRFVLELGAGNTWFKSEKSHFTTSYAVTGTHQEDVVAGPSDSETFLGLRLAWDFARQLTATTNYTNLLTLDENLDDTSDLRVDLDQSLSVAISERLALKASLQLLYDSQPSLESLPLFSPDGSAAGSVLVELDELDSIFKTALVINF